MKKTDNAILKFFIKHVDLKIFNIFLKKTFIASFLFAFGFGIFFIYQETKQCQINGNFKLNPLYTPAKILTNEFFIIRSVTKNYPSIQWYKNKFEITGPAEKNGKNFCEDTIIKFAKELEKEYVIVVKNSMVIYDEINYDYEETYTEDFLKKQIQQKRLRDRDREVALRQVERLISNPDKYTLDWSVIEPVNLKNITKQLILFFIYSLIFAILFTTSVDLLLLIRAYNK
tara:strand:+ start:194 stop:880 length:687 start_codon:yes stop_codon:yes gene_type:complete